MAPSKFLTLKPHNANKSKENSFLYRLSDFSSTINKRKSMRLSALSNIKNIVSVYEFLIYLTTRASYIRDKICVVGYSVFKFNGKLFWLYKRNSL